MERKKKRIIVAIILLFFIFLWLNNTSLFTLRRETPYKFLAHRGLAQVFDESKANWDSNTAEMIETPTHDYIENTISSMKAAFNLGATAVELDVKLSKDGQLAVFHDSALLYRCGVKGEVQDYTIEQLKKMDVGYGYTADGGKTYPLRGKGIGMMPTLNEALDTFPDKDFVIEIKDGKIETYKVFWENMSSLAPERLEKFSVACSVDEGADYLRSQSKTLKVMSKNSLITALVKYELMAWSGYIPEEMKNTELRIPLSYAKFLWCWPYKFMERMEKAGTRVEITAGGSGLSEGFDTVESLKSAPKNDTIESVSSVPKDFSGFIWTNRINVVNPDTVKK